MIIELIKISVVMFLVSISFNGYLDTSNKMQIDIIKGLEKNG